MYKFQLVHSVSHNPTLNQFYIALVFIISYYPIIYYTIDNVLLLFDSTKINLPHSSHVPAFSLHALHLLLLYRGAYSSLSQVLHVIRTCLLVDAFALQRSQNIYNTSLSVSI